MFKFRSIKNEMIVFMFVAVGVFSSTTSATGTQGSGGGGGFWCYDGTESGSPGANVYLLDLWEGENLPIGGPNLTIPRSKEPVEVQFDRAVEKLRQFDSALPEKIKSIASHLFQNKVQTTKQVELPFPDDALTKYKKRDCDPIGLMYYDGTIGKLVYEKKFFDILKDNTEIAAAMFHEAWYKLVRDMAEGNALVKVNNSIQTRKLTACLFSNSNTCLTSAVQSIDALALFKGFAPIIKMCGSLKSNLKFMTSWDQFQLQIVLIEKLNGRQFEPFIRKIETGHFDVLDKFEQQMGNSLKAFDLHALPELPRIVISANPSKYDLPFELKTSSANSSLVLKKQLYALVYDSKATSEQVTHHQIQPIDSLTCE